MELYKFCLHAVNNCRVCLGAVCNTDTVRYPERLDNIGVVKVWISLIPCRFSTEVSISIHGSHNTLWVSIMIGIISNVATASKRHNKHEKAEQVCAPAAAAGSDQGMLLVRVGLLATEEALLLV